MRFSFLGNGVAQASSIQSQLFDTFERNINGSEPLLICDLN